MGHALDLFKKINTIRNTTTYNKTISFLQKAPYFIKEKTVDWTFPAYCFIC